ncbi:hypothetical protein ACTXIP_13680 [Psychrobacter alimentarius]|uniref:hypothetical protein n=1 Tax=Psychrobacter alimentarius TaxID=261164 RepID=UPI003FD105D0
MTCIDFSMSGWSNFFSIVADVCTIIGVCSAIFIYTRWGKQKREEAVAKDAGTLAREIIFFRDAVVRFRNVSPRDQKFIYYMEEKRDSIEYTLKEIASVNADLIYKPYIQSMQELINKFRDSSCPDDSEDLLLFGKKTNILAEKLTNLKFHKP